MIELKIELGISAQRIIQQMQMNNTISEEQIAKGINEAIDELTSSGELIRLVKESTKKHLLETARKAVISYEVQQKIQKVISDNVTDKLAEFGDSIANKIIDELKIN